MSSFSVILIQKFNYKKCEIFLPGPRPSWPCLIERNAGNKDRQIEIVGVELHDCVRWIHGRYKGCWSSQPSFHREEQSLLLGTSFVRTALSWSLGLTCSLSSQERWGRQHQQFGSQHNCKKIWDCRRKRISLSNPRHFLYHHCQSCSSQLVRARPIGFFNTELELLEFKRIFLKNF